MIVDRPRKPGHTPGLELTKGFDLPPGLEHTANLERSVQDGRMLRGGEARTDERQDGPVVYYLGERIYFRPLELADEPLLRRWINDPRVWRYLLHRGPINEQREREYLESLGKSSKDYTFGIVARDSDRLIGSTGLHNLDPVARSATFGIMIGDVARHNQGYGTEATRLTLKFAFQELNLHRIQLSVYGNNWRAIRVYQKVGFVHEGCLRQAAYRNGQYVDEYRFAILREEWNKVANLEVPKSAYVNRLVS